MVTTAVQLFESLFAEKHSLPQAPQPGRERSHMDEAQMLPRRLLLPCLAAIDELVRNYGATVVLCTATQPAVF